MHNWRWVLFLFLISTSERVFADTVLKSDPDSKQECFCEIGEKPVWQKGFFRLGCERWLNEQPSCSVRKIINADFDFNKQNYAAETREIDIGYVGHWANSQQTVKYLKAKIFPLMKAKSLNVYFHDTACSVMKTPDLVFTAIQQSEVAHGLTLRVRGPQVISIGEWESFFRPTFNFEAEVSSAEPSVAYPSCNSFLNQQCYTPAQTGQVGTCKDQQTGQLSQLICCKSEPPKSRQAEGLILGKWLPPEVCP
jgi:hypothetical protein